MTTKTKIIESNQSKLLKNNVHLLGNVNEKIYANCGRWQNSSTDFILVHEKEVVLCTWGNFLHEASKKKREELLREKRIITTVPLGSHIDDPVVVYYDDSIDTVDVNNVESFFESKQLNEFFKAGASLTPRRCFPLLRQRMSDSLSDEPLVFIGDCHIHLFRGLPCDNFMSGSGKERKSLAIELAGFLTFFKRFIKKENIIQVGDFFEVWETQGLFEGMFDHFFETFCEICNNLIKLKDEQKFDTIQKIHNFLSTRCLVSLSSEARVEHVGGTGLGAVHFFETKKTKKLLEEYGLEYDRLMMLGRLLGVETNTLELTLHETIAGLSRGVCIAYFDKNKTKSALKKRFGAKVSVQHIEQFLKQKGHTFEQAGNGGQDANWRFYRHRDVIQSIKNQYPELATHWEDFTFIHGNHDTPYPNLYLLHHYAEKTDWKLTPQEIKKHYHVEAALEKDGLLSVIENCNVREVLFADPSPALENYPARQAFLKRGKKDCIFVEHGHGHDVFNNDLNYFSEKGLDSGYHQARDWVISELTENRWNTVSMKPLDRIATYGPIWGLVPVTQERSEHLFEKMPNIKMVVLGHSHVPGLSLSAQNTKERSNS